MFLSPRMAYNIGLDITDEKADIEAWLTRTSYDLNWCLPVANTVNLSRVVSPLSSNRSMVSSYFEALTNWLQHSHRAVRQGDIISVDIVEERARVASHIIEIEREMDSRDEMTIGQHIRGAGTSTVYFKVTQLDCEDAEFDGTARIVADTTRVTQTGTVQSRVPYMLGRRSSGECCDGWCV
jgi:flagellar basal body L-ring protein FlgH